MTRRSNNLGDNLELYLQHPDNDPFRFFFLAPSPYSVERSADIICRTRSTLVLYGMFKEK